MWFNVNFIGLSSFLNLWIGVQQNVAFRHAGGSLDLKHAGPSVRVGGVHQFGKPVAVTGAARDDEFAACGDLGERVIGEVRSGPTSFER